MPATPQHYSVLLDTLKTYFPTPISNPIMDGYFVHTVSGFLDRVDALKSAAPVLGQQREADYAAHCDRVMPEDMTSVETITALLANYCRGMTVWAHPSAQANVIPPPTIGGTGTLLYGVKLALEKVTGGRSRRRFPPPQRSSITI
jgi:hypothetical protein